MASCASWWMTQSATRLPRVWIRASARRLPCVEECISEDSIGEKIRWDDSDELEFVMDSLAGNTVVPDSQIDLCVEDAEIHGVESFSEIEKDAATALVHLHATKVSKFELDRDLHLVSKLMFPVMFPHWYGKHDQHTNDAAVDLLWMSHGIKSLGVHGADLEGKAFEDEKIGMWKIAYPSMFTNE